MSGKLVYLHIGLPKSGSTYLQHLMNRNREPLRLAGICFPGSLRDQIQAGKEVQELPDAPSGAMEKLLGEIDRSDVRAGLISMETLVRATAAQIDRLVNGISSGREVRVLVTARSLDRSVPAQWQETTQFRRTWSYEKYLDGITAKEPYETKEGSNFWNQHDLTAIVSRWAAEVSAERVTVVTLPQETTGSDTLWSRFAGALGVEPNIGISDPPRRNESLGNASAHLMVRINEALTGQDVPALPPRDYGPLLRDRLAKQVLASRAASEERLTLPPGLLPWARDCSEQMVEQLQEMNVEVAGDLQDLIPGPAVRTGGSARPDSPTEAEMLEAAVEGLVGMVRAQADERPRLAKDQANPAVDRTSRPDLLQVTKLGVATVTSGVRRFAKRTVRLGNRM